MKSMRETIDHVRVCCRVRPLNANEQRLHTDLCVAFPEHSTNVIECTVTAPALVPGRGGAAGGFGGALGTAFSGRAEGGGSDACAAGRHAFTFSHVLRPEAGQADVYDTIARPIVADVMCGYNGTIFMYGQTGSGKTHTMFGDVNGGVWVGGRGAARARKSSAKAGKKTPADGTNTGDTTQAEEEAELEESTRVRLRLSSDEDDDGDDEDAEDYGDGGEGDEERAPGGVSDDDDDVRGGARRPEHALDEEAFEYARSGATSPLPSPPARPVSASAIGKSPKATRAKLSNFHARGAHPGAGLLRAGLARPPAPPAPPQAVAPAPAAAASFCRARATITPLGELQAINAMQNAALQDAKSQKTSAPFSSVFERSGRPTRRRSCGGHDRRSAFAGDAVSGVIPRAVHDVFAAIAAADPSTEFDVQMFFVEVYMEQIRDLLAGEPAGGLWPAASDHAPQHPHHQLQQRPQQPVRRLQLREDVGTNSFYIDGCRSPHVSSASEVLQLVKRGLKQRATSATAMNETSSRSHCLLNLTVKSVNHAQGVSTVGKLYLVDLAGSEKVGKTNATGMRLEEAKLINKSLSTLGLVIMSLTDHTATHTPYRDSVLTKILRDSLGGNSHTALVICCSPSPYNAQETLSTLRFGARAKAIENKAVVNRELTAAQLRRMLETAKEEIERLQAKLQLQQHPARASAASRVSGTPDFPVAASRKLSSAATATTCTGGSGNTDHSRVTELLEERAAEQARLQNLRAEVAQLQDSLNGAQDIIGALQEERDGYIDKVRSFQEEVEVWEEAHTAASKHAATQEALLQQCGVLLHTQASEIKDLIQHMAGYGVPVQQARQAVDQLHASVFGPDAPRQRRRTMLMTESCQAMSAAAASATDDLRSPPSSLQFLDVLDTSRGRLSGDGAGGLAAPRRSTGSHVPDGESPNPRRQPLMAGLSGPRGQSASQQPQQQAASMLQPPAPLFPSSRVPSVSISVSPGLAAAQEWMSRANSVAGDEPAAQHPASSVATASPTDSCVGGSGGVGSSSLATAAHVECVRRLEEELADLSAAHAELQKSHKEAMAELQSKQRLLDLRRNHLGTVKEELRREYNLNQELRERLDKERDNTRGSLDMARNDANYWRRRYEELASRREQPRASELLGRGSLRFALPHPMALGGLPGDSTASGMDGMADTEAPRMTVHYASAAAMGGSATTLSSRPRPSFPGTASGLLSSRASGENVLLSLSSENTPRTSTTARGI